MSKLSKLFYSCVEAHGIHPSLNAATQGVCHTPLRWIGIRTQHLVHVGLLVFALTLTSLSAHAAAPVFSGTISNQTVYEDSTVTGAFDLDSYFSDSDGTACTYSASDPYSLGTMTINGNGTVDFTTSASTGGSIGSSVGQTVLLLKGDRPSITDTFGRTVTPVNSAAINTTTFKYGKGAMSFNGSNQYLSIASSNDFAFGTGDFTIEFWMYAASAADERDVIFKIGDNASPFLTPINITLGHATASNWSGGSNIGVHINLNGSWGLEFAGATNVANSQWHHVAVTRSGNNLKLYVDGVLDGSGTYAHTYTADVVNIGGQAYGGGTRGFGGYLDDIRVTKGSVVYPSAFTPPTSGLSDNSYTSQIFDAGSSVAWNTLGWEGMLPDGKPLPNNAGVETAYQSGNVDMTGNVLLMHMDETSGTFTDASGNNNTGTAVGSPTYAAAGKISQSIDFNGSSQYITVPNSSSLNMANELTMSSWIYVKGAGTINGFIAIKQGPEGPSYGMFFDQTAAPNKLKFVLRTTGAGWAGYASNTTMSYNTWYHVAATYKASTGAIKIYINGQLDNSFTISGTIPATTGALHIGHEDHYAAEFLNGRIDEFAIFNRTLSDSEILNQYKRGVTSMQFQVRSCDDAACSGESFRGPDGTANTYYSEANNSNTALPSLSLTASPTTSAVASNRYFQYRAHLDADSSSYVPQLRTVSITNANGTLIDNENSEFALGTYDDTTWSKPTSDTVAFTCTDPTSLTATSNSVTVSLVPSTSFSSSTQTVAESVGTVTVTATLSATSASTVTVPFTVSGTATASGTDHNLSAGNISITAGQLSGSTTFTVTDDTLDEANETVIVTMGTPTNAGQGSTTVQTITITDNDSSPTVSVAAASAAESSETLDFTVSLSGVSGQDVTVDYTTSNGTAASGSDYTASSGTATITAGSTSTTVNVSITNDTTDEYDETVTLTLSNPTNASLGTASETGTITDNDSAPTASIGDGSAAENIGTTTLTVSLSAASAKPITIDYATSNGTATAGQDYTAASNTLSFAAGETSKTITLTVTNDTTDEDDETVTVTLSNPSNTTLSDSSGTLTITDNDAAPTVSIADASLTEGDIGSATLSFSVSLSAASEKAITVAYATSNGTATAGTDYTAASGTLSFAAGETSKTISVSVTGDVLDEPDETLTATLSSPTNATLSDSSGTGTITDNDATPTVTFSSSSQSAAENAGSVSITVTLSAASSQSVSVPFTLSGTATSGVDYTVTASPVTIAAGETSTTISIAITNDAIDENSETAIVTMGSPTNATQGATTAFTLTVSDNDDAGITVTESGGSTTLTEGGSGDTFTVVLTSEPTDTVTVSITSNAQVSLDQNTLTFSALNWSVAQTVTVTAVNDDIAEGNHTATISMTSASSDLIYHERSIANLSASLVDNDSAGISVVESGGTSSVTEGGATDSYTLVLTSEPTEDVTIAVTGNAEVSLSSASLIFTSATWDTPQTITVTAVNDARVESSGTVSIAHAATSSDPTYDGLSIASVATTVVDNDSAGISITESDGSTILTEGGGSDSYTVVLTSEPSDTVTVALSAPALVEASPTSLVFTSVNWNTPQTVTLSALDDDAIAETLAVTVTHTATSTDTAYNGITITSITSALEDNDDAEDDAEEDSEEDDPEDESPPTPLVAHAGSDHTVIAGQSISLSASQSTGDGLSFVWSTPSAGTLNDLTSATPIYTAPSGASNQSITLTLTVTDAHGNSASDTLTLTLVSSTQSATTTREVPISSSETSATPVQQSLESDGSTTLLIGTNTEIQLPEEGEWTYRVTRDGYLYLCSKLWNNFKGRCLISLLTIDEFPSGVVTIDSSSTHEKTTLKLSSQATQGALKALTLDELFTSIEGSRDGSSLCAGADSGNIDDDPDEEIIISAPGDGDYGVAYIYDTTDASLDAIIIGSEDDPIVGSVDVSRYSSTDLIGDGEEDAIENISFGPDNPALAPGLDFENPLDLNITASARILFVLQGVLPGSSRNFGSTPPEASLRIGTGCNASETGDVNGDGETDLIVVDSDSPKTAHIIFGPISEGETLTESNFAVNISQQTTSSSFGNMVETADVTCDGVDDLLIGDATARDGRGAIFVVIGGTSWSESIDLDDPTQAITLIGDEGSMIGSDIVISDKTGDGDNEIFTITAQNEMIMYDLCGAVETGDVPDVPTGTGASSGQGSGGCSLSQAEY